ncbi:hypothetical protein LOTGIDRAFT_169450 [Lottia gigantea]|uniref:Ig-like domain-containing protein n=1 Tax=Lottia gigantea TaxID=225164 RepID=V3ZLV4_LOTGI|nr:hypothetical protein LOTGIDRAFT_169450 [Lottia gigantea]ESO83380.1 hypothetical protein LOTGIDRAFT_169450 [Lottia gigantea]
MANLLFLVLILTVIMSKEINCEDNNKGYHVEVIATPQSSVVRDGDIVTLTCWNDLPMNLRNNVNVQWTVTNARYNTDTHKWRNESNILTVNVSYTNDCDVFSCQLFLNGVRISADNKKPFKINKINKSGYRSSITAYPRQPTYGDRLTLTCDSDFTYSNVTNQTGYRWYKIIDTKSVLLNNTEKTYSLGPSLTEGDQGSIFQCKPVYKFIGFSLSPQYTVNIFIDNTVLVICVVIGVIAVLIFTTIMVLIFTRRRKDKGERLVEDENIHRDSPSRSSEGSGSVGIFARAPSFEGTSEQIRGSEPTIGSSETNYVHNNDDSRTNINLPRMNSDRRSSESRRVHFPLSD